MSKIVNNYDEVGLFYNNKYIRDIYYTDVHKAIEIAMDDYVRYEGKNFPTLVQLEFLYGSIDDNDSVIKYGEEGIILIDKGIKFPEPFYDVEKRGYLEELLFYLVKAYLMKGLNDKANDIINRFEDKVVLNYSKGLYFYRKGMYDKAIESFTKGNTDNRHKLFMIAKAYEKKLDYENAIKYYLLQYDLGGRVVDKNEQMRKYYSLYMSTRKLSDIYKKLGDNNNFIKYYSLNKIIVKKIEKGILWGEKGEKLDNNILKTFIKQSYDY